MNDFEYLAPTRVDEACAMLERHGEDSRAMAGGTAVLLAMRQRMLNPSHVVSLRGIEALRGLQVEADGALRIGAATRHAELAAAAVVRERWPMLAAMAGQLANPQVRNQGTVGGNLCYADPSTDPPACLLALDAQVLLHSPRGERHLALADFLIDYFTTALQPDELLVAIRVPPLSTGARGHYARHLRTAAEHRPLATLGLVLTWEGTTCTGARIAVGASTPVAQRVTQAEALLTDTVPDAALLARVSDAVAGGVEPLSDARGSADYRRTVLRVLTHRSLGTLCGISVE